MVRGVVAQLQGGVAVRMDVRRKHLQHGVLEPMATKTMNHGGDDDNDDEGDRETYDDCAMMIARRPLC